MRCTTLTISTKRHVGKNWLRCALVLVAELSIGELLNLWIEYSLAPSSCDPPASLSAARRIDAHDRRCRLVMARGTTRGPKRSWVLTPLVALLVAGGAALTHWLPPIGVICQQALDRERATTVSSYIGESLATAVAETSSYCVRPVLDSGNCPDSEARVVAQSHSGPQEPVTTDDPLRLVATCS